MDGLGNFIGGGYDGCATQALEKQAGNFTPPSYLDNLKQQRDVLQSRLSNINALITKLESNPDFVSILDLMRKV